MFKAYQPLAPIPNSDRKDKKLKYLESKERVISVSSRNAETGITVKSDLTLAIVKPVQAYMPNKSDVKIFSYLNSEVIIKRALSRLSGVIALDIETTGTQAHNAEHEIVGIGMADNSNIYYFDIRTNTSEVNNILYNFLKKYNQGFVGHNVKFDGTFLQKHLGVWLDWRYDTYALYRQLSSEGYIQQSYGLKDAQLQLLKWDSKGDIELDEWLVNNGYCDVRKQPSPGFNVYIPDYNGKGERWGKALKKEMHRAPTNILGFYCGLDAASTYQLLTECFLPSIEDYNWKDSFLEYHKLFMENVQHHAAQQLAGITIDKEKLEIYESKLRDKIANHLTEFLNHPKVRPFADEKNRTKVKELEDSEPIKYKKQPVIGKEPNKYNKSGAISKVWINWNNKRELIESSEPEIRHDWKSWNEKMKNARDTEWLNPSSGDHMRWLFYEKLGYPIKVKTLKGNASTGVDAYPYLGEIGKLLKEQKDIIKEHGYVKGCLEHLFQDRDGNFRIHPQFRMPGTKTGRLAGSGGINLQQLPKSREYLECWRPVEGKAYIDCDHTALEQVVLAELSKDPALFKLYGPTAKQNDVYLFNAALMSRDFGVSLFDPIIAAGYDPDNPTSEAIAKCKKELKQLRSLSKVASLGKSYGMGWAKFQENMKKEGLNLSEEECRAVIEGLDKVYAGVKEYEKYLLKQYRENNGYVLNGIGRPVGCDPDFLKDIVNRVIQSTGHDIHMMYIKILNDLFKENNIKVNGVVWDFHDETIVECEYKDRELVHYLMGTKVYEILNDKYLKGEIKLKGDPQYISSIADAKIED